MQPIAMSLEQEVAQANWPRSGKLLSRQNPGSGIFYREFVHVSSQFANRLWEHFKLRGNLIDLVRALEEQGLEIGAAALQNYASGKTNRVPLQVYHTIASLLNEKYGTSLEQKALPDVCSGFYIGMLLAWYFDRVDERTKVLENPMPVAVETFLSEVARADEEIAALLRGTKEERHVAECFARDILTRGVGLIPYSVFSRYEAGIIASLGVYSTCKKPEQLRKAFERADRRVVVRNGHKVSAYLKTSVEVQLNGLILKPYLYDAQTTSTLEGTDYFVGESIMHPTLGKGVVTGVDVVDVFKRGRDPHRDPHKEAEYMILVKFEGGKAGEVVHLIVRKQPPAFNPHFA